MISTSRPDHPHLNAAVCDKLIGTQWWLVIRAGAHSTKPAIRMAQHWVAMEVL
jgi:hypothetical protein